jgi:hypothetical protein
MAVPSVAVGHLLIFSELHFDLILEINLTLENLVINLAPLFLKVEIVGILFDLFINCLQLSSWACQFAIESFLGSSNSFGVPDLNCI